MTRPKATTTLGLASAALVAGIAMFLMAPAQRHPQPVETKTLTPGEARRDDGGASAPNSVVRVRRSETAAREVPPRVPGMPTLERHRQATVGMIARSQENTKKLYSGFFQAQKLSPEEQNEVAAVLSLPEQALAEAAMAAMRSGTLPAPPSPEALRAQRTGQDTALRSLLGEEGFAEFTSYRQTIPDRIIVDGMTRQGAGLSDEQSQQLLEILTDERRKVMGAPGANRNFGSLAPSQLLATIQQDQNKLREAVSRRAETLLSPEQVAALGDVFAHLTKAPKPR